MSNIITPDHELERRRTLGPICGALRPHDRITPCTREFGHQDEHMHHVDAAGNVDATWDPDGSETCDACGHRIDPASGMCMAPLSAAD
jgi:hypothetical protein